MQDAIDITFIYPRFRNSRQRDHNDATHREFLCRPELCRSTQAFLQT